MSASSMPLFAIWKASGPSWEDSCFRHGSSHGCQNQTGAFSADEKPVHLEKIGPWPHAIARLVVPILSKLHETIGLSGPVRLPHIVGHRPHVVGIEPFWNKA